MNSLSTGLTSTNSAVASLSTRVDNLDARIDKNEKKMNANTAGVYAASEIPTSIHPGKSAVGLGVATVGGQAAIAAKVSRVSDNGRWVLSASAFANTQNKYGAAAAVMMHFADDN